jgi:hypothetical protein
MSLDEFDIATHASALEETALLAVHDHNDRETPYATTEALVTGWREAEILTTHGLGHRRILRDPDVVHAVVHTVTSDAARRLPRTA